MQRKNRGIIGEIAHQPKAFSVAFLTIFLVMYGFLAVVDALPEAASLDTAQVQGATNNTPIATLGTVKELPNRIVVEKLGIDASVSNPQSTDMNALDASLQNGAARYPTSAQLGEVGTVVLFGHSSYLPVVHNQTYKTFTGIQTLKKGEIISVYSAVREYRYAVKSVRIANAEEDVVELAQRGKELVIVTCDSFSKKTSRFVVTAEFVGAYVIGN